MKTTPPEDRYALVFRKRDEILTGEEVDILEVSTQLATEGTEVNEFRRLSASLREPEQTIFTYS